MAATEEGSRSFHLTPELAAKVWEKIDDPICQWCGEPLVADILAYPHSGGWEVEGYEKRLWLYIRCTKCGNDWAIWKLGVSRGARF